MEEKVNINIQAAVEFYRNKFGSRPLFSRGCALDQEVLDFLNTEKLGDQFNILAKNAASLIGKNFIARVEADNEFINYRFFEFNTGQLLKTDRTLRGVLPCGDYEFYCFTIPKLNHKIDDPKVDPDNIFKPAAKVMNIKDKLFIAPPVKFSFLM